MKTLAKQIYLILAILWGLVSVSYAARPLIVEWTANPPADAVISYEIYADGIKVATTEGAATQAEITVPDTKVALTVVAVNIAGKGPPSEPFIFPATPGAPKGVKIKVNVTVTIAE